MSALKVTPFQAYCKYNAWKMHFTKPGYDIIKYNGKIKGDPDKFMLRPDKYFYQKLSKRSDLDHFVLANMLEEPNIWVGDLFSDKCEKRYTIWKRRRESLTYNFTNDLKRMKDVFSENISISDGEHPHIVLLYRRGEINLETLVIIEDLLNLIPKWDEKIKDNIIWPEIKLLILKYKPFVQYDRKKCKEIMMTMWGGNK